MIDFFEIDDVKKTVKILKLDDLSIEDLKKYINELNNEIERVKSEIKNKDNSIKNANKYFK